MARVTRKTRSKTGRSQQQARHSSPSLNRRSTPSTPTSTPRRSQRTINSNGKRVRFADQLEEEARRSRAKRAKEARERYYRESPQGSPAETPPRTPPAPRSQVRAPAEDPPSVHARQETWRRHHADINDPFNATSDAQEVQRLSSHLVRLSASLTAP